MDIRCPICNKLYPKIDFSLAGRKFGCECGHKFFLNPDSEEADKAPEEVTDCAADLLDSERKDRETPPETSGRESPADDKREAKELGATALMEVICPKCQKAYPDIAASLVGSKFGCECGHKFFLRSDGRIEAAESSDRADEEEHEPKPRPSTGKVASPAQTTESGQSQPRPPRPPRPKGITSPVVRDFEEIGIADEPETDSDEETLEALRDAHSVRPEPQKRKAAKTGSFLVSWILNAILIALLVSLAYFGYQALSGRLEVPFEIRLQLKEQGDE